MAKTDFGDRIRKIRTEQGMTQRDLAEMLEVSNSAVSQWEGGDSVPSVESLLAISKKLHVSLDILLGVETVGDGLTEDEIRLLRVFRRCNEKGKQEILEMVVDTLLDYTI